MREESLAGGTCCIGSLVTPMDWTINEKSHIEPLGRLSLLTLRAAALERSPATSHSSLCSSPTLIMLITSGTCILDEQRMNKGWKRMGDSYYSSSYSSARERESDLYLWSVSRETRLGAYILITNIFTPLLVSFISCFSTLPLVKHAPVIITL